MLHNLWTKPQPTRLASGLPSARLRLNLIEKFAAKRAKHHRREIPAASAQELKHRLLQSLNCANADPKAFAGICHTTSKVSGANVTPAAPYAPLRLTCFRFVHPRWGPDLGLRLASGRASRFQLGQSG